MRKGCLIYEEMRKYFPIYKEAFSHIWLCNCSTPYFILFFISVHTGAGQVGTMHWWTGHTFSSRPWRGFIPLWILQGLTFSAEGLGHRGFFGLRKLSLKKPWRIYSWWWTIRYFNYWKKYETFGKKAKKVKRTAEVLGEHRGFWV